MPSNSKPRPHGFKELNCESRDWSVRHFIVWHSLKQYGRCVDKKLTFCIRISIAFKILYYDNSHGFSKYIENIVHS